MVVTRQVACESATIIYYDQRGCGKSEGGDSYTWQDHVKDLRRLIVTLAPKKRYS
ncbi:alpha/beta fold hydrolase [Dyadobacter sandarakinus]|uniref:Alpha/beta hydrolase family protein n=1 Tax=Dyadobacter sandarakinus TaxID=2747268 RepID=A0ABX7I5M2_9BACT|nr:hypothetical protein [Dyadobacter sandarakinus]QRR00792.1 hypothetical protein HWI92_07655 [Dyadobacter sandarakinus]